MSVIDTVASNATTTFTVESGPTAADCIVSAQGDICAGTAARFRGALRYAMICLPERVVVDMSSVRSIDSTGLDTMVAARARAIYLRIGFQLRAPSAEVVQLIAAKGLDKILTVALDEVASSEPADD